ncbi:Organic cation/carnitine transporter 2 [Dendrobium catenatum]|uniref:Organic cation/carnitine transporter 2 n=1 Tax=Dendrobium catenatum TaxID=906689 RepID=A0A2I0WPA7_9ASPA|nr:Organic cation/carnitine transporter 2 [Dendrobium catenatum]
MHAMEEDSNTGTFGLTESLTQEVERRVLGKVLVKVEQGMDGISDRSLNDPGGLVQPMTQNCNIQESSGLQIMEDLMRSCVSSENLMKSSSHTLARRFKGNNNGSVVSPAQLLAPKILKFSDGKTKVVKPRSKENRDTKVRINNVLKRIGPLQKLPGIRRGKAVEVDLATSSMEQFVTVVDKTDGSSIENFVNVVHKTNGRVDCDVDLVSAAGFQGLGDNVKYLSGDVEKPDRSGLPKPAGGEVLNKEEKVLQAKKAHNHGRSTSDPSMLAAMGLSRLSRPHLHPILENRSTKRPARCSLPAIAFVNKTSSWRSLYLYTSIPCFLYSIIIHLSMKESPRWLLVKGKMEETIETLKNLTFREKQSFSVLTEIKIIGAAENKNEGAEEASRAMKPNSTTTIGG